MRLILVFVLSSVLLFTGIAPAKSEDMPIVQASEIIAKIQKGEPVNYSHIIVKGDLNIGEIGISRAENIVSPITISDSKLSGSVIFDGLTLQGPINFGKTEFEKDASFTGNRFKGDAIFEHAQFDGKSLFTGSEFDNSSLFQFTDFGDFSDFLGAKFEGKPDFHNSIFHETAFFRDTLFKNEVNFENVEFVNSANFRLSQIEIARFSGAKFNGSADFSQAQFNILADFIGTQFIKDLYLDDVKFSKLLISWDSIKDKLEFNGPTYLLLIKNFKDMEQFEDADNCYYQYRDEERQDRPLGWAKVFDYLALISCGYGVHWQNTMLTGLGVMTFFGIYFSLKGGLLKSKGAESFQKLEESLFFSLTLLLSAPTDWYVNIFGSENYKDIVTSNKYSIFLERVIGWSLLILLVNTLSRVMIRY